MGVLTRYTDFRWLASKRIDIAGSFTFTAGGAPQIARAAGSFVADGVEIGMTAQPLGSASNDGRRFTVVGVSAAALLVDPADVPVAEGPTACALHCVFVDKDGLEEFPGLQAAQRPGRANLMRAAGFDGGFDDGNGNALKFYDGTPFQVSVNELGADAVAGFSDYDWYLSQRTDDAVKQYLSITQFADLILPVHASFSGTVQIAHTARAAAELGIAGIPSVDQVVQLFRFCDLYCRRRSDGAMQWVNPLRAMFGAM